MRDIFGHDCATCEDTSCTSHPSHQDDAPKPDMEEVNGFLSRLIKL